VVPAWLIVCRALDSTGHRHRKVDRLELRLSVTEAWRLLIIGYRLLSQVDCCVRITSELAISSGGFMSFNHVGVRREFARSVSSDH
jgi:hypothetical protein